MKPKNEPEKNPAWQIPVDLSGVKPEDYNTGIDSGNGSASSKRDTKDGTKGFSPQLGGHGKAGYSHTSSFDAGQQDYTLASNPRDKAASQEEGGIRRQSTTSAIVRLSGD